MEGTILREIHLNLRSEKEMLEAFLHGNHLQMEAGIECAWGLFEDEELLGCGCAEKNVLKCFAIDEKLRGQNGLGQIASRLCANRFSQGIDDLFIFTRPHNIPLFSGCGFYCVVQTEDVALLENIKDGVDRFLQKAPAVPNGCSNIGAIVMNANPVTNGHVALLRYAAKACDFLYVFVVEENRSAFPFEDRIALVKSAAKEFPNVVVCPSGNYMISGATFPTYFLKESEDSNQIQCVLDLTLFAQRIAPGLKICKRFVGKEPTDAVTALYNEQMQKILPSNNIEVIEIDRAEVDHQVISATTVRKVLREKGWRDELMPLVPPCTAEYLKSHFPAGGLI